MSSFSATSDSPGPRPDPIKPAKGVSESPTAEIVTVLGLTSLNASASQPSRLSNLGYSNVTNNVNRGAQNAVANQQAHAKLTISVVGKSVNAVSNLGPLQARSSVDVLTNNAVGQTITDLKASLSAFDNGGGGGGGGGRIPPEWQALAKLLRELVTEVVEIEARNSRLHGSGTASDPYYTDPGQKLYVTAGVTLVFKGVPPSGLQLNDVQGRRL